MKIRNRQHFLICGAADDGNAKAGQPIKPVLESVRNMHHAKFCSTMELRTSGAARKELLKP